MLGEPRDAALGLCSHMNVVHSEVLAAMAEGTAAIVREFEASGTQEDLAQLRFVLEGVSYIEDPDNPTGEPIAMRLADYVRHPRCVAAKLSEAHVVGLRLYTTPCFEALNQPLREYGQRRHPFPVTLTFISDGIKFLRAADTPRDADWALLDAWRGRGGCSSARRDDAASASINDSGPSAWPPPPSARLA